MTKFTDSFKSLKNDNKQKSHVNISSNFKGIRKKKHKNKFKKLKNDQTDESNSKLSTSEQIKGADFKEISQRQKSGCRSQSVMKGEHEIMDSSQSQSATGDALLTPRTGNGAVDKNQSGAPSRKKKRAAKRKTKQDGNSNWMSLCSTNHMNPKRKQTAGKRPADPEVLEPETKKVKDEIWFDNVDEIFIEAATEKASSGIPVTSNSSKRESTKSTTNTEAKLVKPDSFTGLTQCVAMDCEMVGIGPEGTESMLARVSIVNHFGVCLYDKFVLPREEVTDYRTFVSGVTKENLATGEEFSKVQKDVSDILKGRTLVGHAVHNDLRVLFLTHPHGDIRDTSQYKPFRDLFNGRNPALKKLSDKLLGVSVQEGQHSSVQDAQATMRLYTMYRQRWEKELKARVQQAKWKKKKRQKKKKPNSDSVNSKE